MRITKACCHGCGIRLNAENDSEAHIIPNALGGRLACKGLICRACNARLDRIADNALVQAFGAWPTLLNLSRQRGHNPSRTLDTRRGSKVRLEPDGSLTGAEVHYDVTPIVGGHKVEISAGNMKTVRQLIKRVTKQFPLVDATSLEKHARRIKMSPGDEIKLSLDFSPRAVFGGAVSVFWLFLLARTGQAIMSWSKLVECIEAVQRHGGTFRYFVSGLPGLNGPSIDIGHKIIVRSVPSTGELIAYLEILGVLQIGGLFAQGPAGQTIEHVYAFDLDNQSDRSEEFTIDPIVFAEQNWRQVGLGPTDLDPIKAHLKGILSRLGAYYARRSVT